MSGKTEKSDAVGDFGKAGRFDTICISLIEGCWYDFEKVVSFGLCAYLHWLPVELRVVYKMLLYAHKTFCDHAPPYICDIITKYRPKRQLR